MSLGFAPSTISLRRIRYISLCEHAPISSASTSLEPPSAPVNLMAHRFNDSVLTLRWDPPHDWGGRPEITYHVQCEQEKEAREQWRPCPDETVILPDSTGLNSTSVSISGLCPQSNFRLSVQAWNSISALQGAPPSSTAAITIHKCTYSSSQPF